MESRTAASNPFDVPVGMSVVSVPSFVKTKQDEWNAYHELPLVPSEADVRRAIFEALELPSPAGWEIVGPNGDVLTINDPSLLALGALDQMVRPKSLPIAGDEKTEGAERCRRIGIDHGVKKGFTNGIA
jgi:hypothetical protein